MIALQLKKSKITHTHFSLVSSVQFICSVMSDSARQWTAARQASLSIIKSQSLLRLIFTESVMPHTHLNPQMKYIIVWRQEGGNTAPGLAAT